MACTKFLFESLIAFSFVEERTRSSCMIKVCCAATARRANWVPHAILSQVCLVHLDARLAVLLDINSGIPSEPIAGSRTFAICRIKKINPDCAAEDLKKQRVSFGTAKKIRRWAIGKFVQPLKRTVSILLRRDVSGIATDKLFEVIAQ